MNDIHGEPIDGDTEVTALPHSEETAHHQAPGHTDLMHVPVKVHGQDLSGGHQGVHFTVAVSTAVNAVQQLLPRDYDRIEAKILSTTQPVILAQSKEMAESPGNSAATITQPSGSYLPSGLDRTIRNCDEVWVAATAATTTLVSVIVSRRLSAQLAP